MENNVITDIRIPFWRLVLIFVKWAIAAIPAAIILVVLYAVIFAAIIAVIGMLGVSIPNPMRNF